MDAVIVRKVALSYEAARDARCVVSHCSQMSMSSTASVLDRKSP
jgi:hypothetical protein